MRCDRRSVWLPVTALLLWIGAVTQPVHSADTTSGLIGRWDSVTRSRGGIGQIIEFQADGSIVLWAAAMVEATYRLEGARLIESYTDGGTGGRGTIEAEVRFEGSEVIQKDPISGEEVRMARQGPAGPQGAPIVGVWSFPHETGVTAFMMFTPDGRMIFRLPMRSERGRWSASGDSLTMGPAATRMKRYQYKLDGDRLTLTDEAGKQQDYLRAELVSYK